MGPFVLLGAEEMGKKPRDRGECGRWKGSSLCVRTKCPMTTCTRWSRAQALRANHQTPAEIAAEDGAPATPTVQVQRVG